MFKFRVADIEADGLLNDITKIHCLSYYEPSSKTFESVTDYKEIKELFEDEEYVWIGHNFQRFDIPALEKIVGIKKPKFIIDTLAISWYLYPELKKHGLEEWGEILGISKVEIKDWKNLSTEQYIHRCEEDVKINIKLWNKQWRFLNEIYEDEKNLMNFLKYIYFKMDCVREQEFTGLYLDIPKIEEHLIDWKGKRDEKQRELESAMPKVAKKKTKTYSNAVKVDGNVFTQGDLFFQAMVEEGAKVEENIKLEKVIDWEDPNSQSFVQIKNWLDELGWEPENIKHQRNKKTGEVKLIPQIKSKYDNGELCPSVRKLFDKEPKLEVLEGLFVLQHRIEIMEGFMENQKDGKIYPSLGGLTNTLRLKHRVIVNLPAIYKPYGKEIRGSIIAPEGYTLVGADLANIEDRTKRHYIYKYDPDYVREMSVEGFDAHLNIASLAGMMKEEETEWYKEFEKRLQSKDDSITKEDKEKYSTLKGIRNKAKVANFSATYKVGAETLARNSGLTLKDAKKLLRTYWNRNKAILDVENDCKVKEIGNTRWLQNPISKFWYSLRSDKDRFSTLNQGTAVYVFDLYVKYIREQGVKIPFQYHDEWLTEVKLKDVDKIREYVETAIIKVNEELKLNVEIGSGIQAGNSYADCH